MSTAVVLAGGASRRMKRDKLALPYDGMTILESAVKRFSISFDKVFISIADPLKYPEIKAERVVDIYKGCGPLAGLHAALLKTDGDGVFLVAADLPYADPRAALKIKELTGSCDAGLMQDEEGRYEPLFGYYKKSLLPLIEQALAAGNYKIAALFPQAQIRVIAASELGGLWNEQLLSNINYPEDYDKLVGQK
jgi:molybdopterin-guanine dinucleotide biosynthesis protein A